MQISKPQVIVLIVLDTLVMAMLVLGFLWWQHRDDAPPHAAAKPANAEAR